MSNLAIFASGSGTNAENIINFFKENKKITVSAVFTNNKDAYVIERARNNDIESFVFSREEFYNSDIVLRKLEEKNIDFIILAGFLWLVPESILKAYPNRIINIHPALLPKYGGKGMYGMKVHESVVENKEKKTGITVHYVNEKYDEGNIIFQAACDIDKNDTPEDVARKVHNLEYRYYPEVINNLL